MSDTSDVEFGNPDESSGLSPDDRAQEGQERLSDELLKIARRCAATPVEDAGPPDPIIGYDEHGLPLDLITPEKRAKTRE